MRKAIKRLTTLCFYAISLHMMVVHVKGDWLACGDCKCKWNSGKKTADCRNISLESVPNYLHSELQVLDLSSNRINVIEKDTFVKKNLQNLHKLFIRNCSLEKIIPSGLRGLEILIELDLSNNLLKTLSKGVFSSLVKLRSLILNNNMLKSLNDGLFHNLEYLKKVELSENHIASIGMEVFANVPLLSQIFLNSNKLSFLRKETFLQLDHLQSLSLELNPWNCTCELQDFREFVLRRNLYTPPTSCHNPIQMRGTLWTDNQTIPFACKPQIIYPPRGTSINTSKENVTLTCRVFASPSTLINWEYNKQIYLSNYQRVHIQTIKDLNEKRLNTTTTIGNPEMEFGRELVTSRLTITGAEKSDEGHYACVALNSAGKDEVEMKLFVEKHSHSQNILLIQNNLIIVICFMVLGLLSASIFLAMVTCCVYKKFRAINHRAAEEQQLQQKRNFGRLNGIVSEQYSGVGATARSNATQANYAEIKPTSQPPPIKLQCRDHITNGGMSSGISRIKSFADLNVSRGLYHENNMQGAVLPQSTSIHTVPPLSVDQCDLDTYGEYQPDLLPYISQSIVSVNSASLQNHSPNLRSQFTPYSSTHNQTNYHQYQPVHQESSNQYNKIGNHHPVQECEDEEQLSSPCEYQRFQNSSLAFPTAESDEFIDEEIDCVNNLLPSGEHGEQQIPLHYRISEISNMHNRTMLVPTNISTNVVNKPTNSFGDSWLPFDQTLTSLNNCPLNSQKRQELV